MRSVPPPIDASRLKSLSYAPHPGASSLGEGMAIVEDYEAIARRLRELNPSASPPAKDARLDKWREIASETARVYVENRRRGPLADSIYHKRREAGARR
jgi:hypothetical protein